MTKCPICGKEPKFKVIELQIRADNSTEYQCFYGCRDCRLYVPFTHTIILTIDENGDVVTNRSCPLDFLENQWEEVVNSYWHRVKETILRLHKNVKVNNRLNM